MTDILTLAIGWAHQASKYEFLYTDSYYPRAYNCMINSELEGRPELFGFLPSVYGHESKLSKDDFMKIVTNNKNDWIFSSKKIRERCEPFFNDDVL